MRNSVLSRAFRSRLSSIFWRWSQTKGLLERTLRRIQMDTADCAFFVSLGISLFLLQVEPVLWHQPASAESPMQSPLADPALLLFPLLLSPFDGLTVSQTRDFLWIFLAVSLVNTWLLNHGMKRFGGEDISFQGWVLRFRQILAAPPFLGLCAFPIWRALMESRPTWAMRRMKPKLSLEPLPPGVDKSTVLGLRDFKSTLNWLGSSTWFIAIWVVPVNLLALRAGLAWLSVPDRQTAGLLLLLNSGRLCLRCLGFLSLGFYLVRRTREQELPWRRKILLGAVLFSWLIPGMSPFLITLFAYLQVERQRIETAVYGTFHSAGSQPSGLTGSAGPDNRELPAPFRWLLGPGARSQVSSKALAKKLGFYRTKTFLLMFDTGALIVIILKFANRFPRLDRPIGYSILVFVGVIALLSLVGLTARIWDFVVGFFQSESWHRDRERHPSMRYALLSGLAFFWGFLIGVPAAEKDTASLVRSLQLFAMICSLQILFLLPGAYRKLCGRSEESGTGALLWLLVFQTLGQLGYEMVRSPELAQGITGLMNRVVLLSPLWAFLLWGLRGSWVLRPFRLKDVLDARIPKKVRWRIGLIALTSALPMGGLAIPFWIRSLRRLEEEANQAQPSSPSSARSSEALLMES